MGDAVYRTGADGLPQQIETDVEPKTSKPSIPSMLDHSQITCNGICDVVLTLNSQILLSNFLMTGGGRCCRRGAEEKIDQGLGLRVLEFRVKKVRVLLKGVRGCGNFAENPPGRFMSWLPNIVLKDYLEHQGDLVSRLIPPRTLIVTPAIPIIEPLIKSP